MWPFKKRYPREIPLPSGAVTIGTREFFNIAFSKVVFAYAKDWAMGCYGGGYSEGRCQVIFYKTIKGNYIRVCQDMGSKLPLSGEHVTEEDVHSAYFSMLKSIEVGDGNIVVITDNLKLKLEEV